MEEQQVNDATVKNARRSFARGFNYLRDVFKRWNNGPSSA